MPQEIGHYRVVRKIVEGGMGVVQLFEVGEDGETLFLVLELLGRRVTRGFSCGAQSSLQARPACPDQR